METPGTNFGRIRKMGQVNFAEEVLKLFGIYDCNTTLKVYRKVKHEYFSRKFEENYYKFENDSLIWGE